MIKLGKIRIGICLIITAVVLSIFCWPSVISIEGQETISETPVQIRPDYTNVTIPANIAPLNFTIEKEANAYKVKIHSKLGEPIELYSKSNKIKIPQKKWHQLISKNIGNDLYIDITVDENASLTRYPTITNKISADNIDRYLFYRRHHPTHYLYNGNVGVYQYDLENNKETCVLDGYSFDDSGCVNCHTFCSGKTNPMTLAIRSMNFGSSMLLIKDGIAKKITAKITYTAWHPSGKILAFSANDVRQFFHSANKEVRDAIDMDSMMAYYLIDSNKIKTTEALSTKNVLETYPCWSPDGKYLYFCKAPLTWKKGSEIPPAGFQNIKYDLVRISYDIQNDQWGQVETIISAKDNSSSNLLPCISPDGRWLLYCQCSYGCFPAFRQDSDLYLVDLTAPEVDGKYQSRKLDINSDQSDAYHSFSSNSRWIVFSSKRGKGPFTRPYICSIDQQGRTTKPFVLPQKDPEFLDNCLDTYTVPELAVEPVTIKANALAKLIRSSQNLNVDIPVSMASPKVGVDKNEYPQVQE